jgi:hypothetical protein
MRFRVILEGAFVMSARVQTTVPIDSLARLRQRMIREVEIFLESSIARSGGSGDNARRIPTRTASPTRPAGGWTSWYHGRIQRSSVADAAAAAGETGPC